MKLSSLERYYAIQTKGLHCSLMARDYNIGLSNLVDRTIDNSFQIIKSSNFLYSCFSDRCQHGLKSSSCALHQDKHLSRRERTNSTDLFSEMIVVYCSLHVSNTKYCILTLMLFFFRMSFCRVRSNCSMSVLPLSSPMRMFENVRSSWT